MKRKIIKLAEKTLVVSLPTTWVKDQNLEKGDEVDCNIKNNELIIVPPNKSSSSKIEITIDGISERVLRWEISSLHKQGYDEIIVSGHTEKQYEILQDLLTNLFIGFIVKERSKLRIIIGEVSIVDVKEFDSMLRRAFRTMITAFEDVLETSSTKKGLKKLIDLEQQNNKETNFCERLLNKNLIQKDNGHFWYVVAWNLEKIVDNFKYIANYYGDSISLEESTILLIEKTHEFANGYYECFYDFHFESLTRLNELKQELLDSWLKQLDSGKDVIISHYMHIIVLQIVDFSASMIALRGHENK